jgi:large subunit ribosomal protein L4
LAWRPRRHQEFGRRRRRDPGNAFFDLSIEAPCECLERGEHESALLAKLVDGEVKCFSDLAFKQPQTKAFAAVLKTIGIDRSCLVALDGGNENARLSARNIDNVTVTRIEQLNAFDLLNHRFMVVDKASLQAFIDGSALKGTKESA